MNAPRTDISVRCIDLDAHHRRARTPVVGLGVAVVIAAGAYATTQGSSGAAPEARPTPVPSEYAMPSERALSELDRTVRALYGPQPRPRPGT